MFTLKRGVMLFGVVLTGFVLACLFGLNVPGKSRSLAEHAVWVVFTKGPGSEGRIVYSATCPSANGLERVVCDPRNAVKSSDIERVACHDTITLSSMFFNPPGWECGVFYKNGSMLRLDVVLRGHHHDVHILERKAV